MPGWAIALLVIAGLLDILFWLLGAVTFLLGLGFLLGILDGTLVRLVFCR